MNTQHLLSASTSKNTRPFQTLEKTLRRNKLLQVGVFAPLMTATVILASSVAASAQSAGFGDAVGRIKGNTIISGAGSAATDLFSFPFVFAGIIILVIILYAVINGLSELLRGRDWIGPLVSLIGTFAVILVGLGIYKFVADSGLIG